MRGLFLSLSLLVVLPLWAQRAESSRKEGAAVCPVEKLVVERLPNMNIPRSGHAAYWLNGELTVFGGHTNGFVPTPTAEYLGNDNQWHLMEMAYAHDDGLSLPLSTGKVLLAGGHSEPLGIGQTFSVEFYDPTTHTFDGFGCLDTKRALTGAVELDSGRVLISGNWYHNDDIEVFDGVKAFSHVKKTAMQRTMPYLLHVAPDDVIIFSSQDTRGNPLDSIVADRLKGDAFRIPLLDAWRPNIFDVRFYEEFFEIDEYTYLLTAHNDKGELGIVKMRGTTFSLLPTAAPIPTADGADSIYYSSPIVDRQRQRCYVTGTNQKDRFYVLSIDYTQQPAPLTLYRSEPAYGCQSFLTPVLSPEGDIIITGGIPRDNFHPHATVYRLSMHTDSQADSPTPLWWLVIAGAALAGCIAYLIIYIRKHNQHSRHDVEDVADSHEEKPSADDKGAGEAAVGGTEDELLQRIRQLMEQERLYLDSDLTAGELADQLGVHRNQLSDSINRQTGTTFSQFVATFRVEHAKKLLAQYPNMKISIVGSESGFSNEKSFFRTFKTATGMTPTEWRAAHKA